MKNSLKYLKLWQKKRSEMPAGEDPQADWLQMQSLLDEQMPEVKRSPGFKGLRILPTMFIAFSAAAMVYMVSNIVSLEKHKHIIKHSRHHARRINPDSIDTDSAGIVDSLQANVAARAKDSSFLTSQTTPGQSDSLIKSKPGKPIANKLSLVNNINSRNGQASVNNNPIALNGQNRRVSTGMPSRGPGHANASPSTSGNRNGFGHNAARITNNLLINRAPGHRVQSNVPKSNNGAVNNAVTPNLIAGINNNAGLPDKPLLIAVKPQLNFSSISNIQHIALPALSGNSGRNATGQAQAGKTKKDKPGKANNNNPSNIDWGILTGVNSSGSFTPKSQNANFYGSSPVDLYFGLFASYKLNNTWAINPQIRLFNPQSITTTYSHANQSKVDSGQNLTITASRKVYSLSIPVYAVYNINNNFSFKAGPVINFPIKQINTNSLFQPSSIKADSTYYTNITGILNKTEYDQKLNFGISAGASIKYKRFIFEAAYLKSLSGYGVTSGLGSYKSYNGTFQFTIGFQLDKVKP